MAEPSPRTGLSYRMDGRHRLQGTRELKGHQQDRLRGLRATQGRQEGGVGPLAGQERIIGLLDVRAYRYQGAWHGGHPDNRHRQPERVHGYHQKRVPRIKDPDMRGAPDTQCMQICGMEGQEGLHRRYETYLQCPQPKGREGRPGRFCRALGGQVFICHKKLEGQLGGPDRVLRVPVRDKEDHLYHQPYREPKRQDQEVHQEQTVLPHRRRGDEIRIFGYKGGHQKVVDAHQELGHNSKSVPYDL